MLCLLKKKKTQNKCEDQNVVLALIFFFNITKFTVAAIFKYSSLQGKSKEKKTEQSFPMSAIYPKILY